MEIILAWITDLTLGVACLASGWVWLGPRLPRPIRLAVPGLVACLALLALAVTAHLPHDYRPDDLAQYSLGQTSLFTQLLIALAGLIAAIAATGRRRTQNACLCGIGLYLAGVGLAVYLMLDGVPTLQAPTLVLLGATTAAAAGSRLMGRPAWQARALGLATGPVLVIVAEGLRGMGSRGGGPATASPEIRSLAAISALLLLLGGVRLLWSHGRVLARPLGWAGAGLAGTWLVLILRGPGEWAPGPAAGSTTLYGLPLTLLTVAVSLAILDSYTGVAPSPTSAPASAPRSGRHTTNPRKLLGTRTWPAWPLRAGLSVLITLIAVWHPGPDACATVPSTESSPGASAVPVWALSPGSSAPGGAPDVTAFNRLCTYRTPGLSQVVYAIYPSCKWAQVDTNYPLVQASGTVRQVDLSHGDSPWIHMSHDLELDLAVDPASSSVMMGGGAPGALLHVEAEAGSFPVAYRPVAGDRVTVAGRWIYDCGHDPKTEIHPAAVVASEHDDWRADFSGKAQQVRILQVWMNSAPGVVHVPLAPLNLHVALPSPPPGPAATPLVRVVAGASGEVQWTFEPTREANRAPEANVHIELPATGGSAYFELLLGYREAPPAPVQPVSYTVAFDRIAVQDDLRQKARNTTGIPAGLAFPQLGFAGSGRWNMQAIVDHDWRSLLDDAPVESGHTYSLATVPPVQLLELGDEHLHLSITGYAENDPSDGVELASDTLEGAAILSWDAGRLADLCCNKEEAFASQHRAWEIFYHVSRTGP